MNNENINKIGEIVFNKVPLRIIKKTIGICNEVFEIKFEKESYILRMNKEKNICMEPINLLQFLKTYKLGLQK